MKLINQVSKRSGSYLINVLGHSGLMFVMMFAVLIVSTPGHHAAGSPVTINPVVKTRSPIPVQDEIMTAGIRVESTNEVAPGGPVDERHDAIAKAREALALSKDGSVKRLINEAISALEASIKKGTNDIENKGTAIDKLQQAAARAQPAVRGKLMDAIGLLTS